MNTHTLPSPHSDSSTWQSAMYAFLAEKHRRSGSDRTVTGYSRTLQQFYVQREQTLLAGVHALVREATAGPAA